MSHEQRQARPKCHLVFTSAGDRSALPLWLEGRRNFDLWVTYYGRQGERYRDVADHWASRRGGKFPNLHAAWAAQPAVFERYDAILVMDDDVIIDGSGISRLFELREQYELSVLQPAFLACGKVSHPVTGFRRGRSIRYSEFVEMTCPVFRRRDLEAFLRAYDGALCGWGTDHWFMSVLRRQPDFRAAIADEIPCVNPSDRAKGGAREISQLRANEDRWRDWLRVKDREGIELADNRRVLASVDAGPAAQRIGIRRRMIARRLQYRRFRKRMARECAQARS